jgi:hypothetical protein
MLLRISILFVLFSNFFCLYSQSWIVGVYTDYNFVSYYNDFTKLPNVNRPNVPLSFRDNNFLSPGLKVEYNLNELFKFGLKCQFIIIKPSSIELEKTLIIKQGSPIEAVFENQLNLTNKFINIQPYAGLTLYNFINLDVGLSVSYQFSSDYNQTLKLVSPSDIQTLYPLSAKSGPLESKENFVLGINSRLSTFFTFPTAKTLRLEPSINVNYNFNSMIKDVNLKNYYFGFGLGLSKEFKLNNIITKIDTVYLRDTITIFTESPREVFLKKSNTEKINSQIVENTEIITFKKYESYQKEIQKTNSVLTGELKTTFILENEEENDKVKIIVNKTYISLYEAKSLNELELIFKNTNTNKYKLNDFSTEIAKIPKIKFYPTFYSEAGLKSWKINIKMNSSLVKEFIGNEDELKPIIWNIANEVDFKKLLESQIEYVYSLTDIENQELQISTGVIKFAIDKRENNTIEKQRFVLIPLILFNSILESQTNTLQESLKNKELYSSSSINIEKSKYSFKILSEDFIKNLSIIKSDYQKYILIKF